MNLVQKKNHPTRCFEAEKNLSLPLLLLSFSLDNLRKVVKHVIGYIEAEVTFLYFSLCFKLDVSVCEKCHKNSELHFTNLTTQIHSVFILDYLRYDVQLLLLLVKLF